MCFNYNYYELKELTSDEKKFFRLLYKDVPTIIKDKIDEILSLHDNEYIIEASDKKTEELINKIFKENYEEIKKKVFIQCGESFMTNIEKDINNNLWDNLYKMNNDFIKDEQNRVDFFSYIIAQMWRVPKQKKLLYKIFEEIKNKIEIDISVDNIFTYFIIFESMLKAVKLSNENKHKIVYFQVDKDSEILFITSDNPVVNICENYNNKVDSLNYEIYWPLSPNLAILITEDFNKINQCINEEKIIKYNQLIINNANEFIISYNEKSINKDLYQI